MENQFTETNCTVILYTYRYIWKLKNGKLCVKFLTETQEAHAHFQKIIREDEEILSCMREYVNEINFEYLGFTEPVKVETKEEKENEENEAL